MAHGSEWSSPFDIADAADMAAMDASLSTQDSSSRFLQILDQNKDSPGDWECQQMDIVDACRGTSVSQTYRGNFQVYTGPCEGSFVSGLPIYKSTDRPNEPLYIYALDVYPDNWSAPELRGLVRWRIVSFENYDDRTSCRIETANIFHIEFAADGQPYNYYPTIYCFDEDGDDISGFMSSTINIRCNDASPGAGSTTGGGGSTGLVIGIIAALLLLGAAGFFLWKRHRNRREKGEDGDTSRTSKDRFKDEDIYSTDRNVERAAPIDGPSMHRPSMMDRIKSFATLPSLQEDDSFVDDDDLKISKTKSSPIDRKAKKAATGASNTSASPPETQKPYGDQPDLVLCSDEDESQPSSISGGPTQEPDIYELGADGQPDLYDLESGASPKLASDSEPDIIEIPKQREPAPKTLPRRASKVDPSATASRKPSIDKSALPTDNKTGADKNEQDSSDIKRSDSFDPKMRSAPARRNSSSNKDPEMDLSQRSRFKTVRSRWSDRSRALGRDAANDDARRSSSKERSHADSHANQGRAPPAKVAPDRSRSMELWKAANHKDKHRSRSRERTAASDHGDIRRSGSKERSGASGFVDSRHKNRGRSTSIDRTKASNHADRSRSRSNERGSRPSANDNAARSRSRSNERSGANGYNERSRSRSKEHSDSHEVVGRSRSRSKESAGASDHAGRRRSQSKERFTASSHSDGGRPRSKERSGSNGFAGNTRSNSAERSGASGYAKRGNSNHGSASNHMSRSRHPSGHGQTIDFGKGSASKGRGSLDASKGATTVTKNPDGTVVVAKKRTREDGAVVTTKTKYANIALARSHGVDI